MQNGANNPANPVDFGEAIDEEPRLQAERDSDPQVAELIEISLKWKGFIATLDPCAVW